MAIKKYYDSDCNLGVLDGKTVAVRNIWMLHVPTMSTSEAAPSAK